jgi:hypothetical protein
MNHTQSSLKLLHFLCAVAVCFCLHLSAHAQTTTSHYQMKPELEQAIGRMRTTNTDDEVLQLLASIQGREEHATQVLLASNSVLDIEERSKIVALVFKLPIKDDGLNAAHIPLLVHLYVNSAKTPLLPKFRPRSFVNDYVVQSHLMEILAYLFNVESARTALAPGEPLPRLLELLEVARGTPGQPASLQKMIEDSISHVKSVKIIPLTRQEIERRFAQTLTPAPKVTDIPTAQNLSPSPTTPPPQTPAAIIEEKSPMWPWVVGILALLAIAAFALKRRA